MRIMKKKNLQLWLYLFLLVGIGNLLMMIDTLLSDPDQTFSLFSVRTSKTINVVFYALISCFLIFVGIHQNKQLKNRKNEN